MVRNRRSSAKRKLSLQPKNKFPLMWMVLFAIVLLIGILLPYRQVIFQSKAMNSCEQEQLDVQKAQDQLNTAYDSEDQARIDRAELNLGVKQTYLDTCQQTNGNIDSIPMVTIPNNQPTGTANTSPTFSLYIKNNTSTKVNVTEIELGHYIDEGLQNGRTVFKGSLPLEVSGPGSMKKAYEISCKDYASWGGENRGVYFDFNFKNDQDSIERYGGGTQVIIKNGSCTTNSKIVPIDEWRFDIGSNNEGTAECDDGKIVGRACGSEGVQNCTTHWDGHYCKLINCGRCME